MKIQVTKEDIDRGIEADCIRCPVVRALTRRGMRVASITNSARVHYIDKDGIDCSAPLPESVRNFIHDFDSYEPVLPFVFELNF